MCSRHNSGRRCFSSRLNRGDMDAGRVCAELESVCREAALGAIREDVTASAVAQRHFDAARAAITPLLTTQSLAAYESWNQPAANTPAKAPVGAVLPPDDQPTECKQQ